MCGIAGLLRTSRQDVAHDLARMGAAIAHRGPDDLGFLGWADGAVTRGHAPPEGPCQLGLAHRRLSILDLTPSGWQPMETTSAPNSWKTSGVTW